MVTSVLKIPGTPIFGVEVSEAQGYGEVIEAKEHKNDTIYKYISCPWNSCWIQSVPDCDISDCVGNEVVNIFVVCIMFSKNVWVSGYQIFKSVESG